MTWATLHKSSEELASAAHEARRRGDTRQAEALFGQAADAEEQALGFLSPQDKPRTFGITAVSAVALWYKARELGRAAQLAHSVLAVPGIPTFALEQLRGLLQTLWNEQAQESSGVSFVPGQILVSVKGGEIVTGGAPLDLVVDKVQTIQALFYRTAEFLKNIPLRRKGPPSRDIQELYRPWLFQSVTGSYQFTVAIQSPKQADLFHEPKPDPGLVAATFFSILQSAVEDPGEGLAHVVPDKDYKATFLKLTRNLAPSGRVFSEMELRASDDAHPILLSPDSRKVITNTLRSEAPRETESEALVSVSLNGILRAVHLDDDWLQLSVDGQTIRVTGVGETVDDVIGPMVNHQVMVQAVRDARGQHRFRDVELEE